MTNTKAPVTSADCPMCKAIRVTQCNYHRTHAPDARQQRRDDIKAYEAQTGCTTEQAEAHFGARAVVVD